MQEGDCIPNTQMGHYSADYYTNQQHEDQLYYHHLYPTTDYQENHTMAYDSPSYYVQGHELGYHQHFHQVLSLQGRFVCSNFLWIELISAISVFSGFSNQRYPIGSPRLGEFWWSSNFIEVLEVQFSSKKVWHFKVIRSNKALRRSGHQSKKLA